MTPPSPPVALALEIGGTKAESAIVTRGGGIIPGSRARWVTGPR
ncbi:putative NBD/HSP70 family sugar kinase [Microbacterium immunditiarum]|uniref:Putative NBD/HSP70 family sugar kinase n=1 Tax=Microbacterium immunditiarum TaxID=337480 RepID=A0A7Y9KIY0_9MICO|nr:putative NBD/HSP70 family sugar kinase [Microbacterium immunditiarum]